MASALETAALEAEGSALLHRICKVGGFAFAGMIKEAAAGKEYGAEGALDMAWEQLHLGPWHSVLPLWRDAYSMASLHLSRFAYSRGDVVEALRVLDMGLILGGTLLRPDLLSAIRKLSAEFNSTTISQQDHLDFSKEDRFLTYSQLDNLQAISKLPVNSLSSKIIEKRSDLSLEEFLCRYFLTGSPVVINDCMGHWPAMTKWKDTDYLKKTAGCRTIPVEVGKNYLCPEWKQELITFSQLLDRIQSSGDDHVSCGPTYLAQHPLFDQIEELKKDICIPDYCFVGGGELRSVNSWFGPAGTVTPLHHDPHHNLLAQVVGKKYVRLYSASVTEKLHPYGETMLANSSQVDLDGEVDEEVKELEFMDCILEEGEMLYIPPFSSHYVRSLSPSFSVSFWWSQ